MGESVELPIIEKTDQFMLWSCHHTGKFPPKGFQGEYDIKWRKDFLPRIGYKV